MVVLKPTVARLKSEVDRHSPLLLQVLTMLLSHIKLLLSRIEGRKLEVGAKVDVDVEVLLLYCWLRLLLLTSLSPTHILSTFLSAL